MGPLRNHRNRASFHRALLRHDEQGRAAYSHASGAHRTSHFALLYFYTCTMALLLSEGSSERGGPLPPISSLLGMAGLEFRSAPKPEKLPSMMEVLGGGAASAFAPAHGVGNAEQAAACPDVAVAFLLDALKREQMKTQALQAHMFLQSISAHQWAPAHLRGNYSGLEHCFDEASGDKRRSSSLEESVLVPRKRRFHVKSACLSCKNSHIACDDRQPCRNCVRRGCRCVRPRPKSAGADSKVAEPAEESEEVQEMSDDASSAPTATDSPSPETPSSPLTSEC